MQIVIHAAALKQVPTAELHTEEAILELRKRHNVKHIVQKGIY